MKKQEKKTNRREVSGACGTAQDYGVFWTSLASRRGSWAPSSPGYKVATRSRRTQRSCWQVCQNSGKDDIGRPCTRKMRPQSGMGFGEKYLQAQECGHSYDPFFHRSQGERRRLLQSREEREFVVDSGASMHMMSKKDLSSDELDTLRRFRNPHGGAYSLWRSANKRGSTSFRSRA